MKKFFYSLILSTFLFACTSRETPVDPVQSDAHYRLGVEFAQYSMFKNSLEEFDLAIKYNPENEKAYRKKGVILFGMKEYDLAKKEFEHALDLDPGNVQIHINLGLVHYSKGDKQLALE